MASTTTGHASSVRCFDNADLLHRFPARSIGTVLSILPIASGIETNLLDNLAPLRDAFDSILVLRFDSILVLRRFILRRHILRRFMPAYAFFNLWHCEQSWLHGCYGCYHLTDGAPARCRLALVWASARNKDPKPKELVCDDDKVGVMPQKPMLVAPLWEDSVNVEAGHGINTRSNKRREIF